MIKKDNIELAPSLTLKMKDEDEDSYSPYCPLCDACGEEGCCSHIQCIRTLVESNPECEYGYAYLEEVEMNDKIVEMTYKLMEAVRGSIVKGVSIDAQDILNEFDEEWGKIHDEIYGRRVEP